MPRPTVPAPQAATILLKLTPELQRVDFTEAFVSPFDVSNKAIEAVMFKHGYETCCSNDRDKKFLEDSLKTLS